MRSGKVSLLCLVLGVAYMRFTTIINTTTHGKNMVKTLAQILTFALISDNHNKKFSLLKSIEKYVVALTLKLSKSDGKISIRSITFE